MISLTEKRNNHFFKKVLPILLLSGSLMFGASGCQHVVFWQKDKDGISSKKNIRSEKDPDAELLGTVRKQTEPDTNGEKKKKPKSSFFSSEAQKIDENLGGTRD